MTDDGRREPTERVLAAEQDERRRIALFLHDGPVQALSGVALMLDAALDFIERARPEQAREVLAKALARTRVTIGELRDLSFNLEPVVLRDHGFATAVHALTESRGIEHGIRTTLDVTSADALGERTQAALYEIVREALEGAIRRGPPSTFSVSVATTAPQGTEVEIHDNAPGERRRVSLEALEQRVRTLGASLSVAQDEDGTTMRIVLPPYVQSE